VTADEEAGAMAILERFGLDLYRPGEALPSPQGWIQG
jgi:hypothetical protein